MRHTYKENLEALQIQARLDNEKLLRWVRDSKNGDKLPSDFFAPPQKKKKNKS